jgi:hypothetical protein
MRVFAADDLPFHHYSLRHRAISWISRHVFDHCTYVVRHGLIRGMRRKGGLGWVPSGIAQTKEEMFWSRLALKGLVIYDVGAFHGILTLFFAARCKQVVSYEPNEINHARLVENVRLNAFDNIHIRKLSVGSRAGAGTLRYSPEMAVEPSIARRSRGFRSASKSRRLISTSPLRLYPRPI